MLSDQTVRRLRWVIVALAAVLVVWIFQMGAAPSGHAEVRNWSTSWIGLDIAEVFGLLGTAFLLRSRSVHLAPVAAATAVLFGVDAWFDVMTALAGTDWYTALACAVLAEIPLAALFAAIAVIGSTRARSSCACCATCGASRGPEPVR
ncbi:hypothetical protein [Yinghuangia seranimata]|uniref:hypothetical protein n=1 Tax=Yinghuangia seranimata TaxID=408067 RepID=UPI00248D302E|nr:hypothetical protein [Yinghuangia seranimata]MDI2131470.1 hypothetical protein [Yinghuangia seranimata]